MLDEVDGCKQDHYLLRQHAFDRYGRDRCTSKGVICGDCGKELIPMLADESS